MENNINMYKHNASFPGSFVVETYKHTFLRNREMIIAKTYTSDQLLMNNPDINKHDVPSSLPLT